VILCLTLINRLHQFVLDEFRQNCGVSYIESRHVKFVSNSLDCQGLALLVLHCESPFDVVAVGAE